ncbi:MAG: hypothetical protein IPI23_10680 [Bacteroidetes bacterium]|nr:hypothetical protein [Bacteroidota bacterium]
MLFGLLSVALITSCKYDKGRAGGGFFNNGCYPPEVAEIFSEKVIATAGCQIQ